MNEQSFMVGYDDDEITAFVPSHLRALSDGACSHHCPNYRICGRLRQEDAQEIEKG